MKGGDNMAIKIKVSSKGGSKAKKAANYIYNMPIGHSGGKGGGGG